MVIPTFIFTRVFAISAVFFGAFPVAYTAPIHVEDMIAISFLESRACGRRMSCLYALPDADSSNKGNETTTASVFPSADTSSSALQIIDLLISAMQSAASSIHESSTATPEVDSAGLATETSGDGQENAPVVEVIDLSP